MHFVWPRLPSVRIAVLALGTLVAASMSQAQRLDALATGARVSLRMAEFDSTKHVRRDRDGVIVGTFVALLDDSVVVRVGEVERLAISRRAIQYIAVSGGRSRARSALVGGLIAGLFAPLFADLVDARGSRRQIALEFALSGAFSGALLPEEQWRRLRRDGAP